MVVRRAEILQGLKPSFDRIGFIGPAEVVPWLQSHWELPPVFLKRRAYPVYWEEVGDGPGLRSVDREVHATAGREAGATRLGGRRYTAGRLALHGCWAGATRLLGRRYTAVGPGLHGFWAGATAGCGKRAIRDLQSRLSVAGAKAQLCFQLFAAPFDSAQGRLEVGPDYKATSFRGSETRCRSRMTVCNCRFQVHFTIQNADLSIAFRCFAHKGGAVGAHWPTPQRGG